MADTPRPTRRHSAPDSHRRQPHARRSTPATSSPSPNVTSATASPTKTTPQRRQAQHARPQTEAAPSAQRKVQRVNPYLATTQVRSPKRRRRRRSALPALIAIVLIAATVGAAVWLVRNPPIFDVSVNGEQHRVNRGITLAACIDAGYASPVAGNLLAIDGTVITEGGGDRFAATIGEEATNDGSRRLAPNDVVTISDGADVTEEFTETTEEIPFGTSWAEATLDSYYWGAIHQYSEGTPGEQRSRTGAVSGITLTEVTRQPIDAGFQIYNANVGDELVCAITFDDGPWPTTGELLDVLADNGVHATFFTIGNQIADYPEVIQREVAEGHQIATHTWDHASGSGQGVNLTYMSAEEQISEVDRGIEAIEQAVGGPVTHVMRAPGGNFYGSLVDTLQGHITAEIGWNVDTMDWSRPGAEAIAQAILSVRPGQVILCHDGGGDRSQTIEALRIALPQLVEQGWKFVTIDELMAYGPAPSTSDATSDAATEG